MTTTRTRIARRKVAPLTKQLADPSSEAVRRNHEQRIAALEAVSDEVIVTGAVLANGVGQLVVHGLGRAPAFIGISAVRSTPPTAGVVQDFGVVDGSGNQVDRTQAVWLRAVGFGAAITVDLLVR